MPCTTILVGKKASYDGSTIMARNEDSGYGNFSPKKFIVVLPEEQPRRYVSKISKVEIDLPDNPMRYTALPDAVQTRGIWAEAGFNACNVAMSATETLTTNPRLESADPLVAGGIGEEDMPTIVLPYIHSAREGVLRLGALLEQYGTYEVNGIGFQDLDEIWWLETVGGHNWIAKRVPDDAYVVVPNQQGIDWFDLKDAYGAKKDHMCSATLLDLIRDNYLNASWDDTPLEENTKFDVRAAFGSHSDADHIYNTPRAWFMEKCLNPNTYRWMGENADYTPESDDLPWSLVPEHRVTIEDVKYVLSSYYQGTPYNPYGHTGDVSERGKYRPIGINRNNHLCITQLRPYVPFEIQAVEWIAMGSNAFNALAPFYGNVDTTPAYLADTDGTVTTDNFYWANRIIGALADAHFRSCNEHIERYQNAVISKGHILLRECDAKWMREGGNVRDLEACNQNMADICRKETDDVLNHVLFQASNEMKNGFSRNDM